MLKSLFVVVYFTMMFILYTGGDSEPILSPVSKLLLINKLPPVLVLHVKRFSIGYTITKSSKHVKFSLDLNMKKYCTEQCKVSHTLMIETNI